MYDSSRKKIESKKCIEEFLAPKTVHLSSFGINESFFGKKNYCIEF